MALSQMEVDDRIEAACKSSHKSQLGDLWRAYNRGEISDSNYTMQKNYKIFHDAYVGEKMKEYYDQCEPLTLQEHIRPYQKNNLTVYGVN